MENNKKPFDGFIFNKALGQNFLSDKNLLDAICVDAGIEKGDYVVEIGTGAGTLTEAILRAGAHVYTFEVDRRLEPLIQKNLADYSDYQLVFGDILNMKDAGFAQICPHSFKVVANLPYYVTTPLIMRFLESTLPCESLTLTVQKEVGERICAKEGTPDYGAVTVSVQSYCDAAVTRIIDRRMFYPAPKVDSCILTLKNHNNKFGITDRDLFRKTVKAVFCARRKTLENNLKSAFSLTKEQCADILSSMDLPPMIRGEKLSVSQFKILADRISEYRK